MSPDVGGVQVESQFETNGLKAPYFQQVETQALSTRGGVEPDVFNLHLLRPAQHAPGYTTQTHSTLHRGTLHKHSQPYREALHFHVRLKVVIHERLGRRVA